MAVNGKSSRIGAVLVSGILWLASNASGSLPPNYKLYDVTTANHCFEEPVSMGIAFGISESGQFTVGQAGSTCGSGVVNQSYIRDIPSFVMVANGLLPNGNGIASLSNAVINSGRSVGWGDRLVSGTYRKRPAVFGIGLNTCIDLGTLGTLNPISEGIAFDIDSVSRIVGQSENDQGDLRATLWTPTGQGPPWSTSDLGTLGGTQSAAQGTNENNDIVGWSTTSAGERHAVRWDFVSSAWQITDLGTLGGNLSEAYAINSAGLIVGKSRTGTTVASERAFLWDNGVMHNLDTGNCRYIYIAPPVNPQPTWILREARASTMPALSPVGVCAILSNGRSS